MTTACWTLFAYLLLVNGVASAVVRLDKRRARRGRRKVGGQRVPERGFHLLGLLGGGLGALLAFAAYRHKTRKPRFLVPFCLATLVGAAVAAAWVALLC